MKINWKVRLKHPMFWISILGVVGNVVLHYYGMAVSDLTSWSGLLDVIVDTFKNPYLLFAIAIGLLNFFGVTVDHTTAGVSDSEQAQGYEVPKQNN